MQALEPANPPELIDPAGGICASARDMAKWASVQLAMGKLPGGQRLWSEEQARRMWRPVTLIGGSALPQNNPANTHFTMYALGWGVSDNHGTPVLGHAGGLQGAVCRLMLIPEKNVGFMVMTNAEEDAMNSAIIASLADHYLGLPPVDRVAEYKALDDKAKAEAVEAAAKAAAGKPAGSRGPSLALVQYAGRYRDPWYGDVSIMADAKGLSIAFSRTKGLHGRLTPWAFDTFKTVFEDPAIENAYVTFQVNADGRVEGAKMKAISPLADFSFDYQDLDLRKVG
jgi:hypothetical protein